METWKQPIPKHSLYGMCDLCWIGVLSLMDVMLEIHIAHDYLAAPG